MVSWRRLPGSAVAVALCAATALLAGCTTAAPTSTSPQQLLDTTSGQLGLVGAAAAVVTPGSNGQPQVAYYNTGSSAVGGSPVTAQTVFEIGSLTKVFTADLLATLVAAGRISLSDPLQKYAPAGVTVPTYTASNGTTVAITIGNLATHQSGLPYTPPNLAAGCPGGGQCTGFQTLYTRSIMWQQLEQTTLLSAPGTDWVYSNFGFGILGTVLADLVEPGQANPPYQNALQSQVLSHFPMPNTAVEKSGAAMATGYQVSGGKPVAQPQWLDTNALAGAGGLVSTTTDLGVWVAAHLGYPVGTSPAADAPLQQTLQLTSTATTVCVQTAPTNCSTQVPQAMGLGWQLDPANSVIPQSYATKNGGTSGFQAQAFLAPSAKVGVVVLANTSTQTDLSQLASQLLAQALKQ